jgi:hypothetical protein
MSFSFPAVHAKKATAAFDGGRLTSNGGVMLLAMAERRLGLADNWALVFPGRARSVPPSGLQSLRYDEEKKWSCTGRTGAQGA